MPRRSRPRSSAPASTASCAAARDRLVGILNGIDTSVWDPAQRSLSAGAVQRRAPGRQDHGQARAARALRPAGRRGSRRAPAGRDDFPHGRSEGLRSDRRRRRRAPGASTRRSSCSARAKPATRICGRSSPRVTRRASAAYIGFDESLAHLIEGGADIFLMPSRFEPCGLNQMYSLRYGTVPVVRAVGGLADTVDDYAPGDPRSTGFVFRGLHGRGASGRLAPRAGRCFATGRPGGPSRRPACGATTRGTIRPASTSEYMGRWQ